MTTSLRRKSMVILSRSKKHKICFHIWIAKAISICDFLNCFLWTQPFWSMKKQIFPCNMSTINHFLRWKIEICAKLMGWFLWDGSKIISYSRILNPIWPGLLLTFSKKFKSQLKRKENKRHHPMDCQTFYKKLSCVGEGAHASLASFSLKKSEFKFTTEFLIRTN